MTDEPDYDPVDCPVGNCSFRDAPRAVAAHVSGTYDGRHDWDRLPFDGAREFVMAEKRAQLEAMGAEVPGGGDGAAAPATDPADRDGAAAPDGDATSDGAAAPDATAGSGRGSEPLDDTFVDDALAVTALLRRYGTTDLSRLDAFRLANLYALLSDLESTAGDARTRVRDALLDLVQDDRDVSGEYGVVKRYSYESRSLKADETVREALTRAGIDPVAVMSLDEGKVREAVEAGRLDGDDVFDAEERASIRRVSVAEDRRDELVADVDPALRELPDDG